MTPYNPTFVPALDLIQPADRARPYLNNLHVFGPLVVATDSHVMAALEWFVFGIDLSGMDGRRISSAQWKALRSTRPKDLPRYEFTHQGVNGCRLLIESKQGSFGVDHDCEAAPTSRPILSVFPNPDPDKIDGAPLLRFSPHTLATLADGCKQSASKITPAMSFIVPDETSAAVVIHIRGLNADGANASIGTALMLPLPIDPVGMTADTEMFERLVEVTR